MVWRKRIWLLEVPLVPEIDKILYGLRRYLNGHRIASGILGVGGVILFWMAVLFPWFRWLGASFPSRAVFVLGSGCSFLWVLYHFVFLAFQKRYRLKELALIVERYFKQLDSRLITAIQFRTLSNSTQGVSVDLVRGVTTQASEQLRQIPVRNIVVWKPVWIMALGVMILLVAVWTQVRIYGEGFQEAAEAIFRSPQWPKLFSLAKTRPAQEWAVGNIEIQYFYPKYTRMETRIDRQTDGSVLAPKGTRILVKGVSSARLERARLVQRGEVSTELTLDASSRGMSGEITLVEDGSYLFDVTLSTESGSKAGSHRSREYPIEILPDQIPMISLERPHEDVEVQSTSVIAVEFRGEDDYGVDRIVAKLEGHDKEFEVKRYADQPKSVSGSYTLDLARLTLQGEEALSFYLRIYDNDTVSGPKYADSIHRRIVVLSEERIRSKQLVRYDEIFENLLLVLGDQLEAKDGSMAEPLRTKVEGLRERIDQTLSTFSHEGPVEEADKTVSGQQLLQEIATALKSVETELAAFAQRPETGDRKERFEATRESGVKEFERAVLSLEQFIYGKKVEHILANSKDLFNRLEEALDHLGKEKPEQVRGILDEFEKGYTKMLAELAQIQNQSPVEEFVNLDAFEELAQDGISAQLDKIRELLRNGEFEKAKEELARLKEEMSNMIQQVENEKSGQEEKWASQLNENLQALNELIANQKKLMEQTEHVAKEISQKNRKNQDDRILEFLALQRERLATISREMKAFDRMLKGRAEPFLQNLFSLQEAVESSVNQIRGVLENRDLENGLEIGRNMVLQLQQLRVNAQAVERFLNTKEKVRPSLEPPLQRYHELAEAMVSDLEMVLAQEPKQPSVQDRKKMESLGQGQEGIRKRGLEVADQVEELSKRASFLPKNAFGEGTRDERLPHMREAQEKLQRGDISGAVPSQRNGLYGLESARDQIQDALSKMRKGGQHRKGFLASPGRRGHTEEGRQNWGGGSGRDDVKIPGAEDYQVPEKFRREVLDAMKKPAPEGYEKLNREYYERLVH